MGKPPMNNLMLQPSEDHRNVLTPRQDSYDENRNTINMKKINNVDLDLNNNDGPQETERPNDIQGSFGDGHVENHSEEQK